VNFGNWHVIAFNRFKVVRQILLRRVKGVGMAVLPFCSDSAMRYGFQLLGRIACTQMWPVVTDGVAWAVGLSVYVCASVGHVREPCKNG